MKAIQEEIKKELQRDKIDELYLNALIGADQRGEMSMEFFMGSARWYTRDEFRKERPYARLQNNCIDVIVHMGGFYIQHLDSGLFYIDFNDNTECDEASTVYINEALHNVQELLWKIKAIRYFYNYK